MLQASFATWADAGGGQFRLLLREVAGSLNALLPRRSARIAHGRGIGSVTLVGAGPGDPDLLTVKALRALQGADVVLCDDLVAPEIQALIRPGAQRIMVGKRGHKPSCRQEDITGALIALARQGRHVLRLKSGDPMIFGRAGEEIAALREAGIPVDVIPGVTAALGAASRLGVSLTHRDHAHSVRFISGHGRHGTLPDDLDWQGLADPATTLVVYMGGRTAPALATRLIAAGLPAETPIVLVENATRADEHLQHGTLATLRACAPRAEGPLILGIGTVFAAVAHDCLPMTCLERKAGQKTC